MWKLIKILSFSNRIQLLFIWYFGDISFLGNDNNALGNGGAGNGGYGGNGGSGIFLKKCNMYLRFFIKYFFFLLGGNGKTSLYLKKTIDDEEKIV